MKRHVSPFIALKFRDFRLLWIGLLISLIGSQMQIVAVIWHIYNLTHSAYSLAWIGLARFLPVILFSPFTGVLTDILNRKKLLILAQIIMAMSALVLTLLTLTNNISPTSIYFLIGLSSLGSALDAPARQSIVPQLVPKTHLVNAISLNTIMYQSSIVIGPSIAGFFIAYLGVGSIYLFNAISFLGVIIAVLLMKPIQKSTSKTITFNLSSLKEGFRFVFKTPLIVSTMLLDFFASFFGSATVLLPIFAKDILAVGPTGLGFLYAAPSFGAITSGLIFSSFKEVKNQGKILLLAVFLYGVATILFGISKSFFLSLIFLALAGVGDVVSTILRNTIRYLATPDHIRGRMVSINMIFYQGGPQLGEVEAGIAAGLFGAPVSVVIGGVGTIIVTSIAALLVKELRDYHGHELLV